MSKKSEKYKRKKRVAAFFRGVLYTVTAILLTVTLTLTVLLACEWQTEDVARVLPSYAKTDITPLLAKDEWSEEDYDVLYHQTGLTRQPLDELKGSPGRILQFQDAFFYEGKIAHINAAPTTPHEVLDGFTAPIAPLQEGDVFVTSTCHTFGWRNGHAAIVTDVKREHVLQSVAPGHLSHVESAAWFQASANFIILRLKDVSRAERAEIGVAAERTLNGLPYSLTVGIFSPKDQGTAPKETHCSHLVWQAYKNFGYDIDSDGGLIVTVNDIANSPLFEVVQVYGFDPDKLWK